MEHLLPAGHSSMHLESSVWEDGGQRGGLVRVLMTSKNSKTL